jgi:hypothetical protein
MVARDAAMTIPGKTHRSNSAAVGEISFLPFVLLALVLIGTPLKADTIITYHLQGVLDDGDAFTGTLDYDTTSREISSIQVTSNPGGPNLPTRETWIKSDLKSGNSTGFKADNGNALITIVFSQQITGTAKDYFGGAFGGAVISTSSNSDVLKKGSVTAVPEPAKLPIVLLGALVLIGVTPWRRILQVARKKQLVIQVNSVAASCAERVAGD